MKKTFNLLLASSIALSALANGSPAKADEIDRSMVLEPICKVLPEWVDKNAKLRIFNQNMFSDWFNVRLDYKIKVMDSYNKGLFTRLDKYNLSAGVGNNLDVIDSDVFGLDSSLRGTVEIEILRQFQNNKDACSANPAFLKNIPKDAETVVKMMSVGEIFTMKSNTQFRVGLDFLKAAGIGLGYASAVSAQAYYVLKGEVKVQILKVSENKVQVRLIGLKGRDKGLEAHFGLTEVIKIFGVSVIDKAIDRELDLTPIQISTSGSDDKLFMVDYSVDINNPEARSAFDQVMNKTINGASLRLMNPLKDQEKVNEQLLVNIEPLEKIFDEDQDLENPRVDRSFIGSAKSQSGLLDNRYRKIGIGPAFSKKQSNYNEMAIRAIDKNDQESDFLITSYNLSRDSSLGFGNIGRKRRSSRLNAVYATNKDFQAPIMKEVVREEELKDLKFTGSDFDSILWKLQRSIPMALFNTIDMSNWKDNGQTKKSVYYRSRVALHREALVSILSNNPDMKDEKVATEKFSNFVKSSNLGMRISKSEISEIGKKLAVVLSPETNGVKRAETFMDLRKNDAFMQVGTRFLIELMPTEDWKKSITFDLELSSRNNEESIIMKFGDKGLDPIYIKALQINGLMRGDNTDLRLESELITMRRLGMKISQ